MAVFEAQTTARQARPDGAAPCAAVQDREFFSAQRLPGQAPDRSTWREMDHLPKAIR